MRIKIFKTSDPEYLLSLILRYRVLRLPLGLNFSAEDLAKDKNDVHIGAFEDDRLIGSLILTDMGDGTMKMRQVAVDEKVQGMGIGSKLAEHAEEYAREKRYKLIHCHARDTAKTFYLKLGYKVVGDEFTEVGIKHYYMEKEL